MKNGIVTQRTYLLFGNPIGEFNPLPSETVPNMTMSIQEIMAKYVRGENITVFEPVYNDDPLFDGIEKMDQLERLELAQHLKIGVDNFREQFKQQTKSVSEKKKTVPPKEEVIKVE